MLGLTKQKTSTLSNADSERLQTILSLKEKIRKMEQGESKGPSLSEQMEIVSDWWKRLSKLPKAE